MKKIIKKIPWLIHPIRFFRTGHFTGYQLMRRLPHSVPLAEGPQRFRAELTLLCAEQTLPLLEDIARNFGQIAPTRTDTNGFLPERADAVLENELSGIFTRHGSDKSTSHDYEKLYARILSPVRQEPLKLLEIGLGTNNTDVLCHMGRQGSPGASLRAFRDFLPNARIFGADIDRRILFKEDRIDTCFVDQVNPGSFGDLENAAKDGKFHLMIDDGLHVANANLTTLAFALKHLAPEGWFVVEDISPESLCVWEIAAALLSCRYDTWIVRARGGNVFALRARRQEK